MSYVHLFRRYLREQGLPVTQQREAVAEVVFASEGHLSVEDIEGRLRERGEKTGKATVYRTLEMLVKSGLVAERDFGEGFKRYEHLFGQMPAHGHMICEECGSVTEIHERELKRLQDRIAADEGFVPSRYRLEIFGVCADCRAAGRKVEWKGLSCPIEAV
ncbi:MAG TPA: Fur family transcriptional regulator [Longimicrobiales bacterium]|nr:Fur family transcriptional regulator [Longimicrobiales bacterium]